MKPLTSRMSFGSLIKGVLTPAVLLGLAVTSLNAQVVELHSRDNTTGAVMPYLTETGVFADSSAVSSVGYNTIGSRYASTYSSIVGYKGAEFSFDIPTAGLWDVEVTWPTSSLARSPIYHEVTYKGGTFGVDIDQSQNANTWVSLGQFEFDAGPGAGTLLIDNSHIDLSGNFYVDSVRLTMVPEPSTFALVLLGGLGLLWTTRRRLA